MTRPSDLHWNLLDDRAFRVVQVAIDVAARHAPGHVLGGGWAVFAHAPVVPSVDCDLYLPGPCPPRLEAELRQHGLTIGSQADVEFLRLDEPVEFLGFGDPDLGVPGFAFVPGEVFRGRVARQRIALPGRTMEAQVPARPALAVAKIAALRGRSLGYLAHGDGRARMLLGPERVPLMLSLASSYYLRKAGKDLFDLSQLLRDPADNETFHSLVHEAGLDRAVYDTLGDVPAPVVSFADDLADRAGCAPASTWLEGARSV